MVCLGNEQRSFCHFIPVHFNSLIPRMSMFILAMFDHFQFALIHGPDILGSYAILLFTASDLASIGLGKYVMACLHLCNITEYFTVLKIFSVAALHSTSPDPWTPLIYCLCNSAFSRMSYGWKRITCSLFRLASFTS